MASIRLFQSQTPLGEFRQMSADDIFARIRLKFEKRLPLKKPANAALISEQLVVDEALAMCLNEEDLHYLTVSPYTLVTEFGTPKYETKIKHYIQKCFFEKDDRHEVTQTFVIEFIKQSPRYEEEKSYVHAFIFNLLRYTVIAYKKEGAKYALRNSFEQDWLTDENRLESADLTTVSQPVFARFEIEQVQKHIYQALELAFPRKKEKARRLLKIYSRARLTAGEIIAVWPDALAKGAADFCDWFNQPLVRTDQEVFKELAGLLNQSSGQSIQSDTLRKETDWYFKRLREVFDALPMPQYREMTTETLQDWLKRYFEDKESGL